MTKQQKAELEAFTRKADELAERGKREGWKSVYPVKRTAPPLGSNATILPFKRRGQS
jgi:hypothetical protein